MPPHPSPHRSTDKPKDLFGTLKKIALLLRDFKFSLFIVLLFAIGSTIFSIVSPAILSSATTAIYDGLVLKVEGTGTIDFALVHHVLIIVLILYAASALCSFVQSWIMANVTQKISFNLRRDIAAKFDRIPFGYFEKIPTGDTLSRITNDVDTLGTNLSQSVSQIITSLVTVVGVLAMMISINFVMAIIVVLIAPLSAFLVMLIVKKSQPHFFAQQRLLGEINTIVEETFNGQQIVKAFNKEQDTISEFKQANENLYNAGWKSTFISSFMKPAMDIVANLGYVFVAVVGAVFASQRIITVGHILAFIQYEKNFMQPIQSLSQIANVIQQMCAAAERIFEFLNEEEEENCACEGSGSLSSCPVDGNATIEFKDVCFGYDTNNIIIHNLNLKIEPGQTIALVGPTGAGKTTIVKLMMRFYDVTSGSIFINGTDIRNISRDEVRSLFGMVLQDTWLFNGTLRDNLKYGNPNVSDQEMIDAAKIGCSHHFIATLPDGYDFIIDENGNNLSQGEKQLLTITRAILSDRQFLILDEATSNVDTLTEKHIQQAMDNLMACKTSFVIAHRLSTIKNADLILVINNGDIVEQGNHDQLLDLNGFYAELYNSQFADVNIPE